jgi:ribonuclease E
LNDRSRGRGRGRNGRRDEPATNFGGPTLPPPSIGPVPTFLDDEAAILEADAKDAADEAERDRLAAERAAERLANGEPEVEATEKPAREHRDHREPREPREPRGGNEARDARPPRPAAVVDPAYPEHYEDALSEALFGKAPERSLAEVEAPAPVVVAASAEAAAGDEGGRKRRRRRRRKKKGGAGEGQPGVAADGAEAVEGAESADDEGDDEEEGTEGNAPAPPALHGDAYVAPTLSVEEEAAWAAYQESRAAEASGEPMTQPMRAAPKTPPAAVEAASEVVDMTDAAEAIEHIEAVETVEAVEAVEVDADVDDVVAKKRQRAPRKPSSRAKKPAGDDPVVPGEPTGAE